MNCIWITVDSFRQDHVHCFHPEGTSDPTGASLQVKTPNLDILAAEGVACERLRMEGLPTVIARRGIFTGRRVFPFVEEPRVKGLYVNYPGWRPIPQEDVTVAEHLSEQGFVCGFVADVYHLMKPSQNFHRGFQSFHWERGQEYDQWHSQPLPEGTFEQHLKRGSNPNAHRNRVLTQYLKNQQFRANDDEFQAARVFRRAIEWLERNHRHENFYLYVDSFDPHEPFEAPQRFIDLYDPDWDGPKLIYGNIYKRDELNDSEHHHIRSRYAAECSMVDFWIGRLLDSVDRLGLRENTLVILISDHGKILGEWNRYGMPPQDTGLELNSVPCIIRHPSAEAAGSRYKGWLYNTDLTVTMLSLLGVEPKPRTDGLDLWPSIRKNAEARDHAVVGHGTFISCWRDDWLYLVNTDKEEEALYNLVDDPQRQLDVSERYPDKRGELKRKIEAVTNKE